MSCRLSVPVISCGKNEKKVIILRSADAPLFEKVCVGGERTDVLLGGNLNGVKKEKAGSNLFCVR